MENYETIGVIGTGSFGTVSKIRRKADQKILVWKELNYGKMSEKEKQMLVSEVNILRELRHPNVVRYYDRIINRETTKIYIVMEYCENGDLSQYIKRCKQKMQHIDESKIWHVAFQVVLALYECHRRKERVLHRDVKPANIFLDSQNNVKLGDFGLARILGPESMFAYTNVGTPYYMSPEQINEMAYNEKSDVWSLGCILYELACLAPPFEASNSLALAMKIKAGRYPKLPDRYSDDLSRSIKSMLQTEVAKRPTVDDLLQLPQVAVRIRERKNAQQITMVKRKEEEMNKKTGDLTARDDELKRRETNVEQREKAVDQREKRLDEREAELKKREAEVSFREKTLLKSPPALDLGKKLLHDENSPSEERTPPLTDRPYLRAADRRNSYPFHGLTNVIDNMPQL